MISIEGIYEREALRGIERRWNDIVGRCSQRTPYLSFEWYVSALETIDSDREPYALFFKSDGEDVALAPLVRQQLKVMGIGFQRIGFVRNDYTPYQGFAYLNDFKDVLQALMSHLSGRHGSRFFLDLNEARIAPAEEEALRAFIGAGDLLCQQEKKIGSRYLILGEDFESTLNGVKKKARKEFARKIKRIAELGEIGLISIHGKEEIGRALDDFFRMYQKTWKGAEPHPEFYHDICNRFDNLGQLLFYGLTIGKRPVAYLICLVSEGIVYGLKTTYDPSYIAFSPGVVLFYQAIEDMFRIPGIREFDIGRGNEQFKREWTSTIHEQTRLLVFPRSVSWQIGHRVRYELIPRIKNYPIVGPLYSRIRSARLDSSNGNGSHKNNEEATIASKRVGLEDLQNVNVSPKHEVRFGSAKDVYQLTVAMSARNVREVEDRFQNGQRCVLILDDCQIAAYFWLASDNAGNGNGAGNDEELCVDAWGMSEHVSNALPEDEYLKILLEYLIKKQHRHSHVVLPIHHESSGRVCSTVKTAHEE